MSGTTAKLLLSRHYKNATFVYFVRDIYEPVTLCEVSFPIDFFELLWPVINAVFDKLFDGMQIERKLLLPMNLNIPFEYPFVNMTFIFGYHNVPKLNEILQNSILKTFETIIDDALNLVELNYS